MQITFHHSVDDSPSVKTFYFQGERQLDYTPGQFVELSLPHDKPDSRGDKRWFTLSSSPTQELLSLTTRFASTKGSSYKKALLALKPGDSLTVSEPMGDFVLPKLLQTPLVFVAVGIGVTPFHSMLQWLADTHETRPIKMLLGVSKESDILFQDVYDEASQHVTIVVSQPSATWGGVRGRITAELVIGLEKPTDDTLIYISGPEAMVEQLTKELHAQGVKKRQIVGDYFPGYPEQD